MTSELELSEQLIKTICQSGWSAYLCGGAVRDIFLDIEPSDYDITTDATPQDLELIFKDRKVNTAGANFLVTYVDGIEISTYRSDKNTGPNRHNCISSACKTLEEDLLRRDFTFNAMAICPFTGEIIDLYNGQTDLENKVVKFVGNPSDRIYEDYLRMLRAARFTCLVEGQLDEQTRKAIIENRELITEVSPERIRIELMKVMKYKHPSIFFDILHDTGLLEILFPEFEILYGHDGGQYHGEPLDVHSKICGDSLSPKNPLLRIAGYFHDIGKPKAYDIANGENFIDHEKYGCEIIEDILYRYKFSNDEIHQIKYLILYHMRTFKNITPKGYRRLLRKLHEKNISWKHHLQLKIADKKANLGSGDFSPEEIKFICLGLKSAKGESKSGGFTLKDLNINGKDVMDFLNIKPGPQVGIILNELMELVLEDPELNTYEKLRDIVLRKRVD